MSELFQGKVNEDASSASSGNAAELSNNVSQPRKKAADKRDEDDVPLFLIENDLKIGNDNAGYACVIKYCLGSGGCGWHRYRRISKSTGDDVHIYIRPGHDDITSANKLRRSKLVKGQDFFEGDKALYNYIMPLVLRKKSNI